jgi:hypothetical protein
MSMPTCTCSPATGMRRQWAGRPLRSPARRRVVADEIAGRETVAGEVSRRTVPIHGTPSALAPESRGERCRRHLSGVHHLLGAAA